MKNLNTCPISFIGRRWTHSCRLTLPTYLKPAAGLLIVPLWMLLFCAISPAQQRINGTVVDKSKGSALPGVTVTLGSDVIQAEQIERTDSEGRFSFAGLSPGRYRVSASADTFYTEQVTIVLGPRAVQQVDLAMSPVARVQEQVTVRAQTKLLDETQASTLTTIERSRISELPEARRTNLADIVTAYVSSAVAGHDNLVHLRGNELSLNTFVNGVSFFDNPHQLFTPGLAPNIIQSVNVITGGFPAEFGNRFGGILDVVTRSGFDTNQRGSITIGAGDFLRHNVAIDYGGHTDRFGYFLFGQAFQSDRFLNTPDEHRFHDQGKGSRGFAQLDYRAGSRDSFRLVLTGGGTNLELPNAAEDELRGRDFFQRNREQSAVLSWEHVFSPSAALSTSTYERFVSARLLPTTDPFSIQAGGLRNDVTVGAKSDYSLYVGSRHAIKMGIDLMQLRLREDLFFDPRPDDEEGFFSQRSSVPVSPAHGESEEGMELEEFIFRERNTGGQVSLYFQDQIRPLRGLTANLGLRYDQYTLVTSGHAFSPRINLAYSLQGAGTVLHFAYNRFFAPPPIENLLLSARLGFEGQPPRIARSNHFEAGASQAARNRLLVRLTGFWRSDDNAFETTELANVRVFAPTSFNRGKAYGLEFSGQLSEIERLGLSGHFSYTAQRAFFIGPVVGGFSLEELEEGQRVPAAFDQIHTAAAGLTWRERRSGVWASAAFEYGSGTPAELLNDEGEEVLVRLSDHFVANFYFGIDLFRRERHKLSLQFNVENATDRVHRIAKESEFTPVQFSPPRFISGSVRVHF